MIILTQCPHCRTVFRLDTLTLTGSAGRARCGVCDLAFNAIEQHVPEALTDESYRAEHVPVAESLDLIEPLAESDVTETAPLPSAVPVAAAPAPEFSFTQPPAHRHMLGLGLLNASLLILLVLQFTWNERDLLVLRWPAATPLVAQMCQWQGCRLQLPHDIEQLKLASTELAVDPSNSHVLHVHLSVQNLSSHTMALPDIAISLSGDDGQTLVRKNITTAQYLTQREHRSPGIAADTEYPIDLTLDIGQLNVSNYKLLLYYAS